MKQKLLFTFVAMTGLLLLSSRADAQTAPGTPDQAAPPPSAQPAPPPGQPGGPAFRRPMRNPRATVYARALMDLNAMKRDLQRNTNDFEGHRDSTLAACDKMIQELTAIQPYVQTNMPAPRMGMPIQQPGQQPNLAAPAPPPNAPAPPQQ